MADCARCCDGTEEEKCVAGEEREIKSAGESFITLHDVLLEIHHENYGNIIVAFVVRLTMVYRGKRSARMYSCSTGGEGGSGRCLLTEYTPQEPTSRESGSCPLNVRPI